MAIFNCYVSSPEGMFFFFNFKVGAFSFPLKSKRSSDDEAVEHGRSTTEDGDVPRQPSVLESFTLH